LDLRHDGPPWIMKLILRLFFKQSMINQVPYKPNLPTAPAFVVTDQRDFETERNRLIALLKQLAAKGRPHFEGKAQITLGRLSAVEWNNLMYKHLDHHLRQFGV